MAFNAYVLSPCKHIKHVEHSGADHAHDHHDLQDEEQDSIFDRCCCLIPDVDWYRPVLTRIKVLHCLGFGVGIVGIVLFL